MIDEYKYFKDEQGQVFAFLADGSEDEFISPLLMQITKAEADALRNPPPPPTTAAKLKEIVTAFRWEVETGGITLPGGIRVATGIDDQNRITTVVANARLAALETVKFKAASGWVTLTLAEIEAVAATVALHVQQCFAAECAHHEAIDALVVQFDGDPQGLQAALDAYDEVQGWPGTGAAT
ncbi:DUF4376 domain-containing protein [Comamonas thiooxydans]|uniref:DUF4376 domain-containing protein n=1 Tax=Comamonas thiooxydans TaxID=363952 RepID=UPI0018A5CC80|nr:DUF4376 domain-containing protein [Comamonas thiooxydans]QOQ84350.1 DUF4376 domain-containing protein [Comamonas thiooxydans]